MSMYELWHLLHSTESQNQKEIVFDLWSSLVGDHRGSSLSAKALPSLCALRKKLPLKSLEWVLARPMKLGYLTQAKLLVCQPYLLKRKGRTITLLAWWPEIRLLVSFTRQAERKTTGAVYLVGYP